MKGKTMNTNHNTNQELLQKQLILNALRNAKQTIKEIYTDQETGKTDYTFGDNKELNSLYYRINDVCISLSNDNRFWYTK